MFTVNVPCCVLCLLLAVIWEDFVYVLTVSNYRIYAIKKRYVPTEA